MENFYASLPSSPFPKFIGFFSKSNFAEIQLIGFTWLWSFVSLSFHSISNFLLEESKEFDLQWSKLLKQATTTSHHKAPQSTEKHQQTTTNDYKAQKKRLQTPNKLKLTTSKQPQPATSVHKTKNLTFRFFFPHPIIPRNTPILRNILLSAK